MAFIGVRISWLMFARNWLLAWFAFSAVARATSAASLAFCNSAFRAPSSAFERRSCSSNCSLSRFASFLRAVARQPRNSDVSASADNPLMMPILASNPDSRARSNHNRTGLGWMSGCGPASAAIKSFVRLSSLRYILSG